MSVQNCQNKTLQGMISRDGAYVARSKAKNKYLALLFVSSLFFLFGFGGQGNPLLGTWECDADKTMNNIDTGQLSAMQEQFYFQYFENVSLEVSEAEMISRQGGRADSRIYEIDGRKNDTINVHYPEEDENDRFKLLEKNRLSWSMEMEDGRIIEVFFEKQ